MPRIFAITVVGFSLTFLLNIQDPSLLTYKVRQLAPDLPNTAMGMLTFVGLLVAMLVQPIVGALSDRTHTPIGRRLPFIISGAIMTSGILMGVVLAPSLQWLILCLILLSFSSNWLQSPWQALIPDQIPDEQHGAAAGLKAVLDILAFIAGGLVAGIFMGKIDVWGQSAALLTAATPALVFVVAVTITFVWGREKPETCLRRIDNQSIIQVLRKAYFIDFRQQPLFGWWFANRILLWGGFIALNTFLINYLIDVVQYSQAEAQSVKGILSAIIGGALALVVWPAGRLSDKVGRKPMILMAGLLAFLGSVLLLFAYSQFVLMVFAGVLVGLAVGVFLSASWALATDIVPRQEAARYLGIANMATCIGSGGARLLGGLMIDPINRIFASQSAGYLVLYVLAAVCFLISSVMALPLPNTIPAFSEGES